MTSFCNGRGLLGLGMALILTGCASQDTSILSTEGALPSGAPLAPAPSAPTADASATATIDAGKKPVATTSTPTAKTPTAAKPKKKALATTPDNPAAHAPDAVSLGKVNLEADDSTFDNVEFVDSSLSTKLRVTRVGSERTSADLLSVFAGLKNKTTRTVQIEVQTVYKDKTDNSLTGKGSWIPLKLKAHEEMEYRSVALSSAAVDFMVRIRKPLEASAQ